MSTSSTSSAPIIEFAKVNKWYGEFHVLRDIDLSVARGERIVICGPSGSGKSTLIRCINRLEEHQEGRLAVDGVELSDDVKAIEAVRRQVGMVFQQFNLFPHLTVLENVRLAVQSRARTGLNLVSMWNGHVELIEKAEHFLSRVALLERRATLAAEQIGRAHV